MSALDELADILRADETVISGQIVVSDAAPALGELVAAGPRTSADADEYSLLFEAIREGYLLHYAQPRLMAEVDPDLALLAGDYLYAMGLERLAALGDLEAVRELSDLISLSAHVHDAAVAPRVAPALWLASALAVACGRSDRHEAAKAAVRDGAASAAADLWAAALAAAALASIETELERAGDAIGFAADLSGLG